MDMSTVKILLITVLTAVVGGCVIGVLWGKHTVKKITLNRKPLLTPKERLIYLGLLVLGAACVALGVIWPSTDIGDIAGSKGEAVFEEGVLPGAGEDYIENPGAVDELPGEGESSVGEANPGEDQTGESDGEPGDDAETEDVGGTKADAPAAGPASGGGAIIGQASGGTVIVVR